MPALLPYPAVALTCNASPLLDTLMPLAASYRMPVCWSGDDIPAVLAPQHEIAWQLSAAASAEELAGAKAAVVRRGHLLHVVALSESMAPGLGEQLLKAGVTAVCTSHAGRQPRRLRYGLWEFPVGLKLSLQVGAIRAWRQRRTLRRVLDSVAEQGGLLRIEISATPHASPADARRRFEPFLKLLCRERDLGRIRVEPISVLARQLSHRPRPAAARSILRTQAA